MSPTVIAAAVAVALLVLVVVGTLLARRGRSKELPPEEEERSLREGEARQPPLPQEGRERQGAAPAPQQEAEARPTEPELEPELAVSEPPEAQPEVAEEPAPPAAPTEGEVTQLKKGLASTRGGFISRLAQLFGSKKEINPELLEQVEEVLLTADIGVQTTQKILGQLRERMERNELSDPDRVWKALREQAREILSSSQGGTRIRHQPTVVLVVGVNGTGKTTTIGKLASRYREQGRDVIVAAGDTFRAAAVEQLERWGEKVGCDVVKGKERADPGSVIFDAIKQAQDREADVVIADTAGRLHTKTPLMEELKKVSRTIERALGRPADETLLVLDATTGQNASQQAQMFKEALPVSGIVLTKLDGTAKGGVILGIVDEHGLPVRYVGIGERVEDLREFDPESFIEALFTDPNGESIAA